MSPPFQELERVSRVAPLGVRFRDSASGALVGGGLKVTAYPPSRKELRRTAQVTPGAVYVLQDLSGLRRQEHGAGDAEYWTGVERRPFVVEVEDLEGRFQPFSFGVSLPHQGLFGWGGGPLAPGRGVPLFSAPARCADASLAVLRAELWDTVAQAPAAWALVDVTAASDPGGPAYRGLADREGRVALFFQYPPPLDFETPDGTEDLPLGPPMLEQQWTLEVRARYARRAPGVAPADVPDLTAALAQPAADAWPTTGAAAPALQTTLRYGREAFASTQGAPLQKLWITPT